MSGVDYRKLSEFSLFGLDPYTSVILIVAVMISAVLIGLAIGILAYILMTRSDREWDRVESERQTDRLIPPIFYTDAMKDPLFQEDLRESCEHLIEGGASFRNI